MANLLEFAKKLHQERLFIRSEQESIHQLNKQIRLKSEQLSHAFWTSRQHHLNLNHFIANSSQDVPATCSQRAADLDNMKFVDAYKELGYQESMYANFLHAFRSNPTLAAACLAYGEKLELENTVQVVQAVVLGLYGNGIISGDHGYLLELMETLLLLQLANEDQPRKVIHKGNSAFCIVYRLFTESSMVGKSFLTSALHKPILQVLMEDELYLERDSKKILDCFSQVEIEKKFGKKDDPEFQNRVKKHLKWTEDKFFEICQSFIESLNSAMFCFPESIGWVISRTFHIIKEAGLVTPEEARALCSDLMLQMFICPAIVTPELYGISGDAPISEFTRFNLMLIAQTLQVLALRDGENRSDNLFYSRFEKNCVSSLLDTVIDARHTESMPATTNSELGLKECSVFLTCNQLAQLVQFLTFIQHSAVRGVDQSSLAEVLNHLPNNPPPVLAQSMIRTELQNDTSEGGSTPTESRHNSIVGTLVSGSQSSPMSHRNNDTLNQSGATSKKLFSKSQKHPKTDDHRSQQANDTTHVVLVISLAGISGTSADPPGMLSENEVLEMQARENNKAKLNSEQDMSSNDLNALNDPDSARMDKQLRFSHYSMDFSELGEGGIEVISRTSGSSMDDIDPTESVPADDASSFRGTSSHGNQDEDLEMEEGDLESVPHANNDEALKALERKLPTSRESIEDKMRKFVIRPQLGVRFSGDVNGDVDSEGDQAEAVHGNTNNIDTRSETWSTDVYASDSETPTEQGDQVGQRDRLQEIAENPEPGQIRSGSTGPYLPLLPRDEDSRSDVWSVEVLPSDSEPPDVKPEDRLQELESESNIGQDPIDPEDNRSRASTPGLSAASGVSATSGLSLVSDNLHAKAGEEQGSSSEKSFGKTPSSISPDADEMINIPSTSLPSSRLSGAGSSNSSASGDGASSNPRPPYAANHTSYNNVLGKPYGHEESSSKQASKSAMKSSSPASSGRHNADKKLLSPVGTYNRDWSVPMEKEQGDVGDGSKSLLIASGYSSISTTEHSNSALMPPEVILESDNTNTIKRSPYKQSGTFTTDEASAFNSVPYSSARDCQNQSVDVLNNFSTAASYNDSLSPSLSATTKPNGILRSSSGHYSIPTSTFVPITSTWSPSPPCDLSAFDPLASSFPETTYTLTKPVTVGNSLLNMNSMSAALVTIAKEDAESQRESTVHDQQSQVPSPIQAAKSRRGHVKNNGIDVDSKGIERKKSWWKSPRFSVMSGKRKNFKSNQQNSKDESSVDSPASHSGGSKNLLDDDNIEFPKSQSSPLSAMDSLGEDIMEKYIRKAASNQSSPKSSSNREPMIPYPSSSSASNKAHENSKSSLDETIPAEKTNDSHNPNSSSNTDPHSTPSNVSSTVSERTVTTVTRGTSPNLSPEKSERTMTANSLNPKTEYKPESAQLVADAQRKLRQTLATCESFPESVQDVGFHSSDPPFLLHDAGNVSHSRTGLRHEILSFLRLQLAEGVSLQDHSRVAQIYETERCIHVLDDAGCKEVLQNLWKDYKKRAVYVAYLVRTKQALLTVSSYLRHMCRCTERDQETCRRYLTTVFVNLFLKHSEESLKAFRSQFTQATAADEKVKFVNRYLSFLNGQMSRDQIWQKASKEQLREAERAIERSVFVYIYNLTLYPNGEGDVLRDQLFAQHITRLNEVMTTQHPALLIPKKYLNECPWMSAQAEVKSLNAYKTPRDKLDAVLRCCITIMNLLKMADEETVPGADDFTPVLVYVLIKANPPHLLSTVQYIASFLGEELTGEDSYWWMQFTAATEFIKTIDERK